MGEIAVKVVLADIEGTTTSISFVKNTLFPYAKEHTENYLRKTWHAAKTEAIVRDLINLPEYEEFAKSENISEIDDQNIALISRFVNYLIDKDLKLKPLKSLQGYVWADGYRSGKLKGHVYPDVPDAFKRWHESGINIAIFSSGSIKSQELLFGQTDYGSLLPFISGHFDITSGHKQERQTYDTIAQALGCYPSDILFLTDTVGEAEVARTLGYHTYILSRPGNRPLTDDEKSKFTVINDFESIKIISK